MTAPTQDMCGPRLATPVGWLVAVAVVDVAVSVVVVPDVAVVADVQVAVVVVPVTVELVEQPPQ